MRLDLFDTRDFDRGRPAWIEAAWLVLHALLVSSWIPGTWHRVVVLRLFGAYIGKGVVFKPAVRIKFPWRLNIGDHTWIGEGVWIDNLVHVTIGSHCCLSQGAYLCTGSHDWASPTFDLIVKPISISDHAWLAARTVVAPGVTVGQGAVLALGSVATGDLAPWKVYQGVPAIAIRERRIGNTRESTDR